MPTMVILVLVVMPILALTAPAVGITDLPGSAMPNSTAQAVAIRHRPELFLDRVPIRTAFADTHSHGAPLYLRSG
jgi:hypothetical protein